MPPNVSDEILERVTRIETKLEMIINARDIALEANQSTKAAHHRLDEMRGEIASLKQNRNWMVGTTISVLGLFIAAVGLLWKLGGAGP